MPRLSGPEVLSRLKRSVSTAGIPVVVLTGSEETGTEAELLEMGAEDYIRKPIEPTRFLARIRAALRRVSETEGAGWVFLKPQAERMRRIG
jgi:DNA-binding response OmpR family regulator